MAWKPANGRHAIERASVSFIFREPLTQHAVNGILGEFNALATAAGLNEAMLLPPPVQLRYMQTGPIPGPIPQQILGPPPGRSMRRSANNKVLEDFVLIGDSISYSTQEYNRWNGFRDKFSVLFPKILSMIATTTAISELRLEYWDRFDRYPDENVDAPLINQNSTLVGEALRVEHGSWHSHVGFFAEGRPDLRTLANLNVDVIASAPGIEQMFSGQVTGQARVYTLATVQSVSKNNPLGDWYNSSVELERVHDLLNSVMADVLHKDIASSIQLNAEPIKLG